MTAATITLNVGTGGDKPLVDTLSTVNGAAAPAGASAQMVKVGHGDASDFKTASQTNPLPFVALGNGLVSTVNSSTAVLAANAALTGTGEDISEFAHIIVSLFASHASATDGVQLQQSLDGTNWDLIDAYTLPAATGKTFSAPVQGKFFRIVFTNGATLQTVFRLQTIFSKQTKKGSSVRPQDGRSNENDFDEVLAYGMGWNGTTWDRIKSTAGALNVVQTDVSTSGNLAAAAQTVVLALVGNNAAAAQITGTWVGTITFEASLDGTTWTGINAVSASTSTPQTTTTVNGLYRLTPGGLQQIRANMSAFTSGTATVSMRASAGAGGTFANQILPTRNTDGTSTQTIKPASTAAVVADQAAVVALHPSSPLPVGANVIGALTANQSVNTTQIAGVAIAAGSGVVTAGTPRIVLATDVIMPAMSEIRAATLHISVTAAVNTALTATLPAPAAGLFHYITSVQLVKVYNVLGVAAGAGVVVTSTNLPGTPNWTTEQAAGAIGTAPLVINYQPTTPLKASAAAVATTFVAPAQLQTIWRWNVSYFTAA